MARPSWSWPPRARAASWPALACRCHFTRFSVGGAVGVVRVGRARACPCVSAACRPPRVPDPRFCFPVNAVEAVEFTVEKTCCRGGLQQLYIYHTSPQAAPEPLQLYSALQRSTALYSALQLYSSTSSTLYNALHPPSGHARRSQRPTRPHAGTFTDITCEPLRVVRTDFSMCQSQHGAARHQELTELAWP